MIIPYKKHMNFLGTEEATFVERIVDSAFIPFDPANTDYQAYLTWLAEGNTPLPPDQTEKEII
jgi:hypothetical protein